MLIKFYIHFELANLGNLRIAHFLQFLDQLVEDAFSLPHLPVQLLDLLISLRIANDTSFYLLLSIVYLI